jgi:hypothetical protein
MRYRLSRFIVWTAAGILAAAEPVTVQAEALPSGWQGVVLRNGLVSASVVPELAGRCMQFELAGRPLLWLDPAKQGTLLAANPGPDTHWQFGIWGGFKTWLAPQSAWKRGDCQIQGWPPAPQLDHGLSSAHLDAEHGSLTCHGTLEGHPHWRCVGMHLSYTYQLYPGTTRCTVTTTMTNLAAYPQRWSLWNVTAVPARPGVEVVWAKRSTGDSRFGPGERMVQAGAEDDAQWASAAGDPLVRVRCQGRDGKVSGDTDGGWIAAWDPQERTVLVQRFAHVADRPVMRYPEGGSTVAAYVGQVFAEVETMSPEYDLDPGQAASFSSDWTACRIAARPQGVVAAGVVVTPLTMTATADGVLISGSYGCFAPGAVILRSAGKELARWPGDPREPLVIEHAAPRGTVACELVQLDADGNAQELAHTALVR